MLGILRTDLSFPCGRDQGPHFQGSAAWSASPGGAVVKGMAGPRWKPRGVAL